MIAIRELQRLRRGPVGRGGAQAGRQLGVADLGGVAEQGAALDDVGELADLAGPRVVEQVGERGARGPGDPRLGVAAAGLGDEVLDQAGQAVVGGLTSSTLLPLYVVPVIFLALMRNR